LEDYWVKRKLGLPGYLNADSRGGEKDIKKPEKSSILEKGGSLRPEMGLYRGRRPISRLLERGILEGRIYTLRAAAEEDGEAKSMRVVAGAVYEGDSGTMTIAERQSVGRRVQIRPGLHNKGRSFRLLLRQGCIPIKQVYGSSQKEVLRS